MNEQNAVTDVGQSQIDSHGPQSIGSTTAFGKSPIHVGAADNQVAVVLPIVNVDLLGMLRVPPSILVEPRREMVRIIVKHRLAGGSGDLVW